MDTIHLAAQADHHQTANSQTRGLPTDRRTKEMRNLKENSLEKTVKMDRANSHLESLTKAIKEIEFQPN